MSRSAALLCGLFLFLSVGTSPSVLAFVPSSASLFLRQCGGGLPSGSGREPRWSMSNLGNEEREVALENRRSLLLTFAKSTTTASAMAVFAGFSKQARADDGDSWALLRGGGPSPSATFKKPPLQKEEDPWIDDEDDGTVAKKEPAAGAKAPDDDDDDDNPWPEGKDENTGYKNPNIPQAPEERSGLVVLRVAEVATFQEKILRAVASGTLDVMVAPNQIQFGTEILLKNSNLDGNMKLMINDEIPEGKREAAARNAARALNTLQTILTTAADTKRPFEKQDLLQLADLYNFVAFQLDEMYQLLPPDEKKKYYGYFKAVTEYEKKVAEGTYNPDTDGILKFK